MKNIKDNIKISNIPIFTFINLDIRRDDKIYVINAFNRLYRILKFEIDIMLKYKTIQYCASLKTKNIGKKSLRGRNPFFY